MSRTDTTRESSESFIVLKIHQIRAAFLLLSLLESKNGAINDEEGYGYFIDFHGILPSTPRRELQVEQITRIGYA